MVYCREEESNRQQKILLRPDLLGIFKETVTYASKRRCLDFDFIMYNKIIDIEEIIRINGFKKTKY